MIAALFVEKNGCYTGLDGVDPWDIDRDARLYAGPHPVVAHPPCQRWGRYWHGSPRKPHRYRLGEDGGCFDSALYAIQKWGGILEHPAETHAWGQYEIHGPRKSGGWGYAGFPGGWVCHVEQGHYGHLARKPTWLLACSGPALKIELPEMIWGACEQRIHPRALELHGYDKARRIGMMAMVGGKDKTKIRNATPIPFRDILLSIATSVGVRAAAWSPTP